MVRKQKVTVLYIHFFDEKQVTLVYYFYKSTITLELQIRIVL